MQYAKFVSWGKLHILKHYFCKKNFSAGRSTFVENVVFVATFVVENVVFSATFFFGLGKPKFFKISKNMFFRWFTPILEQTSFEYVCISENQNFFFFFLQIFEIFSFFEIFLQNLRFFFKNRNFAGYFKKSQKKRFFF